MCPVSALAVDTSVWIDFFRGEPLPDLERALQQGFVLLPPLVCAELLSAPLSSRKRSRLTDMLRDLPLAPTPFDHWTRVGALRARLLQAGLSVSTPDAHIAQCTLDCGGLLWSRDNIFVKVVRHCELRLFTARAVSRPDR
jgi:predicted nucleic acid-binding protein